MCGCGHDEHKGVCGVAVRGAHWNFCPCPRHWEKKEKKQ